MHWPAWPTGWAERVCATTSSPMSVPRRECGHRRSGRRHLRRPVGHPGEQRGGDLGAPIDAFPDEAWLKLANVNLIGLFRLTTRLLDPLRRNATPGTPATIINIGSLAGLRVTEVENYPYSATKAGVHMLTRHLAGRLAREHITVNAVAPGYFPSRMSAFALDDESMRAELLSSIPLGRTGTPEDIVGAVQFLASRAGAYLTGSVLEVDGGAASAT